MTWQGASTDRDGAAQAASLEDDEGADGRAGGEGGPLNPFTVFVREDGTVDWDGAIQSGKDFAKFSSELLGRLQGKSPEGDEAEGAAVVEREGGGGGGLAGESEGAARDPRAALAAIDASPAIAKLLDLVVDLEQQLKAAETERDR